MSSAPRAIVYIHGHDIGRYIGTYGAPVQTPHLDAFARDAVVFRNAHSAAPTCSPSRAGLLTGLAPHQVGVLGLAHRGFPLTAPERHLAHLLRDQGYRTVLCGMQHVWEGDQAAVGYTDDVRPRRLNAVDVLPGALSMIRTCADARHPLFLDVGFEEAHRPFHVAEDAGTALAPNRYPDTAETRQDAADLGASVREFDRAVGEVLSALDAAGLADEALVIITTDHGIPFPGMKCTLNAVGTGVLLMLCGPASSAFRGGAIIDALVSQQDVLPTICDLGGWPIPDDLPGHALQDLVRTGTHARNAVFGEVTFHATWAPSRSIRTPEWLYIEHLGAPRPVALANVDDGLTRSVLKARGWPWDGEVPARELYDLVRDPGETMNVADFPELTAIQADLRERLHAWMRATDDPAISGDWQISAGARMNRLDARSADEPTISPDEELDFSSDPPRPR